MIPAEKNQAAAIEEAWTVTSEDGVHLLIYQGNKISSVRGEAGLATQKKLAALFNKSGTVPKHL